MYHYDSYGRLLELTYPSGISIRNHYKNNGFLWEITEADAGATLLWEANHINAKEQLVQSTTGNIITSTFGYQPETGLLTSINAYTDDQILQDLEYSWDVSGNLTSRKKWIDRDSAVYLEETFQYDELYRLTNIKLKNNSVCTSSYDDFGNVLQKTPLTQMQYGGTGASPYSLVSATCTGDVISHNEQNITYTLFDKISAIQEGDYQLNMIYGTDDERVKQEILNGDNISTTIYLGGLCEKITENGSARFLNYVNSPQGLIAIIVRGLTGPPEINYILTDHQGSYQCITDNAGNLVEELSFDAWGRRRNAETWTFDNMPSTYLFDRGYTGHEHLDMFGLINMNGRAYDPVTGRFLSVDPFVQAPDFTQSYNRYTYCLNNPLKYTDPDGEFIQYIFGAVIGGFSGYMMADAYGYKGWDKFWYTLGGAAIGAATAGIGTAVSYSAGIVVGSFVSGATSGACFGTMGGYAAGLRGGDLFSAGLNGMWQGVVSSAVGSIVGGAIGGGWGAFAGGAAAGGIGAWMSGGSDEDILTGVALSGVIGLGLYHASLAYSYYKSGLKSTELGYNRYAKMMATTQRSMFWNREGKFIPNSKGGINVNKLGGVNKVGAKVAEYNNALFEYHTHQDWGSPLSDGEGFSTYVSGKEESDEYTRSLLNNSVKFKGPMYLGTREGHIWYMNSDFSRGMLPYNFSSVFIPFNITWSLSLIR